MSENKEVSTSSDNSSPIKHGSLILFIVIALVISGVLTVISMNLYNSSGAAQLDLSRPGYVDVRSQATSSNNESPTFSPTGTINENTIKEFKELLQKQKEKIDAADAFSGDPLNPQTLGLESVSTE